MSVIYACKLYDNGYLEYQDHTSYMSVFVDYFLFCSFIKVYNYACKRKLNVIKMGFRVVIFTTLRGAYLLVRVLYYMTKYFESVLP